MCRIFSDVPFFQLCLILSNASHFLVVPHFCKYTAHSQMRHNISKCAALFQLHHIFRKVLQFFNCAAFSSNATHFFNCAAFFQMRSSIVPQYSNTPHFFLIVPHFFK